jgi:hypothetical protein
MLLFQKRFHQGLVDGRIRVTVRQWEKPLVKPGGRYRVHPIGVVEVDAVEAVALGQLSDDDARLAGFSGLTEMREYMAPVAKKPLRPGTLVFRVTLHHAGDGDRVAVAMDAALDDAAVEELKKKLARLDKSERWTWRVMRLIVRRPKVAASKLARSLGRETLPFKAQVVKLKKLGLTQSFEVGYEVSPRGKALMERLKKW